MIDPVIHWVLTLCICGLWLQASVSKLRHSQDFDSALRGYQLLPATLVPLAIISTPLAELAIALGTMIPVTRPVGALLSAVLLSVYALAMAINLLRGRIRIDCGCTPGRVQSLAWALVLRNVILAFLSLMIVLPLTVRKVSAADLMMAALIAAFAALMWLLLPILKSNRDFLLSGVRT